MNDYTCRTCIYSKKPRTKDRVYSDFGTTECRRHAAQMIEDCKGDWPVVYANMWCGEGQWYLRKGSGLIGWDSVAWKHERDEQVSEEGA